MCLKEASSQTVEIKDLDAEVVEDMLRYIYTGQVESKQPGELLKAAHKYILDDLLDWCVNELCGKIATSNIVELLVLAKTYDTVELKAAAISHTAKNWTQIRRREDWKTLIVSYPDVVADILDEVFEKSSFHD